MTEKCINLRNQHGIKFGYGFIPPLDVLKEEPKACEEFCNLIQQSLDDDVDYLIGHYGITQEYIEQQKYYFFL